MRDWKIEELVYTLEAVIESQRRIERAERAVDVESGGKLRDKSRVLEKVRRRMTDELLVKQAEYLERNGARGRRCPGCGHWIQTEREHECPTRGT